MTEWRILLKLMTQKNTIPKKKVGQSTFDDLVLECIVDLDMSPSEAVEDAKIQLEAQVFNTNIII